MKEKQCVNVALLGFGTVGYGVYKLLEKQKEELPLKVGTQVNLKKILVRDVEKARKKVAEEHTGILTTDIADIMNDEEIQIVIEVMGGMNPAQEYIEKALTSGKNVVTANKDLIAVHGGELLELAGNNQKDLLFEAAVAGGIPIIRPLKQCLAGNHISEVMGIVNGTTNFILTKMTEEGMEFEQALALATELGYAEADPTADVEGLDAGRKLAILASIAFNSRVTFADVSTEGITKITAKDIRYAKEMECHIKLLAMARNVEEEIEVGVHPMLIPSGHPLASVSDAYNAVFVKGDAVADAMFFGRGAGELPTASAIMGDVIDIVRNICCGCTGRIHCTCYKQLPIKKLGNIVTRYFLRMQVEDRAGVLAGITSVFGNNNVSIAQIIQKKRNGVYAEIVVITDDVLERNFKDSLKIFEGLSMIKEISSVIRVYGE